MESLTFFNSQHS